ncbi:MAG: DUF1570 domain-containing protein [Planctomycetaceae bacterium]|nr:DUF1570 domain-containing protein [Planctomycetaceae bacterium]
MRLSLGSVFAAILLCLVADDGHAGGPATIELQTGRETFRGKSVAHNKSVCWLVDGTGELNEVKLDDVTAFKKLPEQFRPDTVVEIRDQLTREAPPGTEVAARGKYVVLGPKGQAANYARLLDGVYSEFWSHFSRRQFQLQQPEFPLIVLVFPSRAQFVAYARAERTPIQSGLKGYYHRSSNRIALYADSPLESASLDADDAASVVSAPIGHRGDVLGSVEGSLRDTLIHEATHQLAYNTGLHSRMGDHPRWVSEGLAMLFEEDSRRDDRGSNDPADRANRSRYIWFMNYRQQRRPAKSLEQFLSADDLFSRAGLDAYSEAWALSFYLIETRRADYAKYLQSVAARDPLLPYTPEERLADFRAAFGKDISYFEGQYLLFLERMSAKIR